MFRVCSSTRAVAFAHNGWSKVMQGVSAPASLLCSSMNNNVEKIHVGFEGSRSISGIMKIVELLG